MSLLKKSDEIENIAKEIYDYTNSLKQKGMNDEEMKPLVMQKVLSYGLTKRKTVQLLLTLRKFAGDETQ